MQRITSEDINSLVAAAPNTFNIWLSAQIVAGINDVPVPVTPCRSLEAALASVQKCTDGANSITIWHDKEKKIITIESKRDLGTTTYKIEYDN